MKFENLKSVYSSYKTAPVEIREKFALSNVQTSNLLFRLKEMGLVSEAIILSTCNRTEIYYVTENNADLSSQLISLLLIEKGIIDSGLNHQYFNAVEDHFEAVNRLFSISAGLDSQVLGDLQITGQVKHAYQLSADANMSGPFMHRLMHTIFFTNKRIVQETSFRDGAASVSYAAVELTESVTDHILEPNILVIGTGKIGADVCRTLKDKNFKNICILNRTVSKAEELGLELGFSFGGLEQLTDCIAKADVIIGSVSGELPLVTKKLVREIGIQNHKYFIDLSIPRSIETEVEEIPGAILYNVDHIQNKTTEALQMRRNAIPKVQCLIAQSAQEFNDWTKEMVFSPTVQKLKNSLEQIRQEEVARHLKQLTEKEAELIETVTKSLMQKIIKFPVLQLKAACKRGEQDEMIDILNDLFDLERTTKVDSK
ncbi:MAG: glutamyl-tRNA reductase [Opitutaceae bacterium]|nr:glutamyl-tRNA reductase [Cytophagales bacterium]